MHGASTGDLDHWEKRGVSSLDGGNPVAWAPVVGGARGSRMWKFFHVAFVELTYYSTTYCKAGSVDFDTSHSTKLGPFLQGMCFIHIQDDPRIKVTVILKHTLLPNEISTFPSKCVCQHLLGCLVKSEVLCSEATSQLILCGTHATDFPVKDCSWHKCDHLVGFHCGWHWGNLA